MTRQTYSCRHIWDLANPLSLVCRAIVASVATRTVELPSSISKPKLTTKTKEKMKSATVKR